MKKETNTIYVSEVTRDSEFNALTCVLEVTQVAYYLVDWNLDSVWSTVNEIEVL